jgi:hypothetical protein
VFPLLAEKGAFLATAALTRRRHWGVLQTFRFILASKNASGAVVGTPARFLLLSQASRIGHFRKT